MVEKLSPDYAVGDLCEFLQVSRNGYYAWQNGEASAREQANRKCRYRGDETWP